MAKELFSARLPVRPVAVSTALVGLAAAAALAVGPSLVALLEALSGHGFDIEMLLRIHFAFATWLLSLALAIRLFVLPAREPAERVALQVLGVQAAILLAIWAFDRDAPFSGESSALTFFSAAALLLVGLVALANRRACRAGPCPAHGREPLFWAVAGVAFLFAALDEEFALHERIAHALAPLAARVGVSEGLLQDGITLGYAVGAVVFVALFQGFVRAELRRAGASLWLFFGAIALYALAVLNDTADVALEAWAPTADPEHLMNFLEEVLEFAAAGLFLASFLVRLRERVGGAAPAPVPARVGHFLRVAVLGLAGGTLIASAALAALVRPPPLVASAAPGIAVSVFADAEDGLDEVDGLLFAPGVGLLAANESGILRFAADGAPEPWVATGPDLRSPESLAWGEGRVYVTDDAGASVLAYDPRGTLLGRRGSGWRSPEGIAVDGQGRLIVADEAIPGIVRLEAGGPRLLASALDGLRSPEELCFDDEGNLYVSDEGARRVFRISPEGRVETFLGPEQGLRSPEGIAWHAGHLYVSDPVAVAVLRYDPAGRGGAIVSLARRHRDLGGLAFDDRGILYLSSASDYRPRNFVLRIEGVR